VTVVGRFYVQCSGPCRRWLAIGGHTASFDTPGLARKAAAKDNWTTAPSTVAGVAEPSDYCPTCTPKET
jgi:hypothetical protein